MNSMIAEALLAVVVVLVVLVSLAGYLGDKLYYGMTAATTCPDCY